MTTVRVGGHGHAVPGTNLPGATRPGSGPRRTGAVDVFEGTPPPRQAVDLPTLLRQNPHVFIRKADNSNVEIIQTLDGKETAALHAKPEEQLKEILQFIQKNPPPPPVLSGVRHFGRVNLAGQLPTASPNPARPQEMLWDAQDTTAKEALLRSLYIGEAKPITHTLNQPGGRQVFEIDGAQFLFKPDGVAATSKELIERSAKDPKAYDSSQSEIAASRFDELLGFDLVPTAIPCELNGRKGSLHVMVQDLRPAAGEERGYNRISLQVFDYLIGNDDRHQGNRPLLGQRAVAIDNGMAFRGMEAGGFNSHGNLFVGARIIVDSQTGPRRRLAVQENRGGEYHRAFAKALQGKENPTEQDLLKAHQAGENAASEAAKLHTLLAAEDLRYANSEWFVNLETLPLQHTERLLKLDLPEVRQTLQGYVPPQEIEKVITRLGLIKTQLLRIKGERIRAMTRQEQGQGQQKKK